MRRPEDFDAIYLHRESVDFRKSINGLAAVVQESMGLDLMGQSLFVFSNRGRDKLKILYWDRTGFALWYKRLEKARFSWPRHLGEDVIRVDARKLGWLLDGYEFWRLHPHETLSYEAVL